ncbi:MAG: hypothetical protein IT196_10500, partial [Acidimicrobiales bacterium]|nr:hypothetical protein [Acidimicrobiales bacterium]
VDIQPDGAIVTVGYADLGYKGQGDTVVVRHLADGDLDPAFGEGGFALTRTGRYWNRLNDVVVTADGDIAAAGELEYDGPFDAAVIRYNPDGSTDPGLVTNALDGAPGAVAGGPAVVMDGDARVFDNELVDAATWGGTSLSVSRAGGAVASDEFGASGGLGALTEAGPLVLDGLAVGTVTANSGGSLVLDFGGGAGVAEIGRVLESLTFRNPTIPSGPATLLWTFSDGAGGDASGTVTVTVTPLTAVVNSTGDAGDANPGDAVCDTGVLNSEGDPACTLRAAIEELNALGRGAIHFAIPTGDPGRQAGSPGWWTISPISAALPTITASIELDATTQPGWASAPVIRLDGAARSGSTGDDGLALGGSGITVRGLSVTNWPDEGMQANGTAVTLAGNWFGVAPDGSVAANVSDLVVWGTATGATVGGPNPADGNRFAGAGAGTEAAIYLMADTAGTTVRNNTFGLGPDGVAALGMDNAIALLGDTTGTTITGNRFGHIAGTAILHLDRATATVVAGNTFGLDANGGDAPLGRVLWHDSAGTVRFGGVAPADANTVRHTSQALAAAPTATGALTMLGNSIAGSLWSGFDLGADGVSVNDPGDGDTGPNGLLNVPVLDAVSYAAGAVVVDHTLDIPSGTYRVELFTNPAGGNASGYGEGEVLAHATTVSHGGGALSYRAGFAAGGPVVVTATVTEDLGGGQFGATSEFSAAVAPAVASGATVLDAGGRRSDLVARDGADLSGVPGVAGPAVAFDGSAARLVGPATDVVSGGLTLSGWVRLDAAGDDPRVVAKAASDGAAVYELLVDDATGEAVARLAVTGGVQEVRGGSVLPGAWHMVAATWDGSTVRLYVDGTEVDGAAAGGALGTDVDVPLVVGNVGAGDRGLPGRVDQVQVAHVARSAAWLTTEHANVRDPASFVTMGAAQSAPPAAWSVADGVGRTGRRALAAPSGGGGADAWITAVGIDEPGVEVVSWWKLSDPSGVDVAVGTRTGAVPVDQDELALRYGTLELASNQGPSRTSQASVASTVGAGTWTKVVLRTDEAGTTTAEVGELSTVGPVAQGASPGGSVGFRAGVLLGSSWHIDDVRVRRFVSEEPVVTVHAVERN